MSTHIHRTSLIHKNKTTHIHRNKTHTHKQGGRNLLMLQQYETTTQADFVRYGNANQIMKMSKEHTTQLWNSVIDNDYAAFSKIHTRLLNAPATLKHAPIRIYIPSSPSPPNANASGGGGGGGGAESSAAPPPPPAAAAGEAGSFRIVQALVPVVTPDRKPKLLGQALKDLMPALFPSSRDPVLASVVLHGVPAPFNAPLGEMMREAAYPDGWLCFVVVV